MRIKPIPWRMHIAHWRMAARLALAPQAPRLQPAPQFARINRYPAFRSSARPSIPRIPAGHNVGLGSARAFSSGPAAKTANNVPIFLRAFTQVFDEDKEGKLPTARRYIPYPPPRGQRTQRTHQRAQRRRRCSETSHASLLADLAHFFPTRGPLVLPPTPETLITPGVESTLSLPLAPGLDSLLAVATPEVSYADAEVGSAVLATLLPLGDAISLASARVLPLLARLESLGVLDDRAWPRTKLQVEMRDSRPDILRVVFESRSSEDITALLRISAGEAWYTISERWAPESEEQWERVPRSAGRVNPTPNVKDSALVMPAPCLDIPEVDEIPSPMPSGTGTSTPSSLLDTWDESEASFLLDLSAVSSVSDWTGDVTPYDSGSEAEWSTSSLASGVLCAADMWAGPAWTVPPSAEDVALLDGEGGEVRFERALLVAPW